MIVIEPNKDDDYDDEYWQGTINELSHITEKQIAALKKGLDKRFDKQQNFIQKALDENRKKIATVNDNPNERISKG